MIDHDRLAAIVQSSQRGRAQVITDFRQANALDARYLHVACASSDFAQIALLAHRIKGACLMLGATGLAEACSLLALAGRAHSSANAREAMAFYDRQAATLDAYLEALPEDVQIPTVRADRPGKLCGGLRFVVAEDHDFQRNLIMMLLRNAGAETVSGVEDGAAALEQIHNAEHSVDILVLDLSMPGMSSTELLQRLAESKSSVAVILNSALSPSLMSVILQQMAACDVRILGVVSKPLTASALKPLVEAFHKGNQ